MSKKLYADRLSEMNIMMKVCEQSSLVINFEYLDDIAVSASYEQ